MRPTILGPLAVVIALSAPSLAQEEEREQDFLDQESELEDEQDFPDLVGVDETGGIIDEFAFLEEEIAAYEVESASKHRQSIFWSPSAITVFTREDIRNSGATNLADLLRRVPGFDIYRMKPGFPLIGARSMTSLANNLVLLLIDGREALFEAVGFTFWSGLATDFEEIERVEVIRGPGSALYGANAFAAVVSITTVADRPASKGDIIILGGEVGQFNLFGRVQDMFDLGDGVLSYGVGLGRAAKASPSDMRDTRIMDALRSHGYLRYRRGRELDLSLQAGMLYGGGTFAIEVGDQRLLDALTFWTMAKAKLSLGETAELKTQVYHNRVIGSFFFRNQFNAYDMWICDIPDTTMVSNSIDAKVQLDWQLHDDLLFISGGNLRYTTVVWEKIFQEPYDELRGAGFVHLQWSPYEKLQLTGGLRLDLNTLTETALSPRVVAVFRPWDNQSFRLGYGLAFRKPSAYETKAHATIEEYNPATPEIVELLDDQFGNEKLKNENVSSLEAGWLAHFFGGGLRISLDLFYNQYRDTIIFVIDVPTRLGLPDIPNSTIRRENAGADVNSLGGEAELNWSPVDPWHFWGNLGLRFVTEAGSGDRMPSEPRLRANLGARYSPGEGLFADLALHYVSKYKMPLVSPLNILENPELIELGDKFLLIGRTGYRFNPTGGKPLEAGLAIVTPLGKPYREYPGTRIPPWHRLNYMSDFWGENLVRLMSVYLRGVF